MNKPLGAPPPAQSSWGGTTHRAGEQPPPLRPSLFLPRGGAEKQLAILPLALTVLTSPRGAGRMEGAGGRKR